MKKLIFLIAMLLPMVASRAAVGSKQEDQTGYANTFRGSTITKTTIIKRPWTIGPEGDFADIDAAMEDSRVQDGDELHILERTNIRYVYNKPQKVTKAVTITGNGYEAESNGFVSQLAIECDGASVKQLYLSTIYIRANNVTVDRCKCSQIDGSENYENNNAQIRGCFIRWDIRGRKTDSPKGWVLCNNLFVNTNYTGSNLEYLSNAIIDHNLFVGYDATYYGVYLVNNVRNSEITNNIILKGYFSQDLSYESISTAKKFEYNIISSNASSWPTNKFNSKLGDVCVCKGSNSSQEYYRLSTNSIAIGYANDGGDCGPWSGKYPYFINGLTPSEAYAVQSIDGTTLTFYYDKNKTSREGTVFNEESLTKSEAEYRWKAWGDNDARITTVTFDPSFEEYDGLTSTAFWFNFLKGLSTINGLEYLNTSNVTDMSYMFNFCESLTSLDLSTLNTANVTNMAHMFHSCSHLSSINLKSFNTENVTDMRGMFNDCKSLTSLDLRTFKTDKVRYMGDEAEHGSDIFGMFQWCNKLTTIHISDQWSTESVEASYYMFAFCTSIVGGDGTTYSHDYTDASKAYAGIGGYLTLDEDDDLQRYLDSLIDTEDSFEGGVYTRRFLNGDWQTLYVPFEMNYSDWVGRFEVASIGGFYWYDDDDDNYVDRQELVATIVESGSLQANFPYLIRAKSKMGGTLSVNVSGNVSQKVTVAYMEIPPVTYSFIGNYSQLTGLMSAGRYRLQGGSLFIPLSDSEVLLPYRWYMTMDVASTQSVRLNIVANDETTGIEDVKKSQWMIHSTQQSTQQLTVFDLSGRRVDADIKSLPKGIYLINGKKQIIK